MSVEALDRAVDALLSLGEETLSAATNPIVIETIADARRWKAAREAGLV